MALLPPPAPSAQKCPVVHRATPSAADHAVGDGHGLRVGVRLIQRRRDRRRADRNACTAQTGRRGGGTDVPARPAVVRVGLLVDAVATYTSPRVRPRCIRGHRIPAPCIRAWAAVQETTATVREDAAGHSQAGAGVRRAARPLETQAEPGGARRRARTERAASPPSQVVARSAVAGSLCPSTHVPPQSSRPAGQGGAASDVASRPPASGGAASGTTGASTVASARPASEGCGASSGPLSDPGATSTRPASAWFASEEFGASSVASTCPASGSCLPASTELPDPDPELDEPSRTMTSRPTSAS